VCNPLDDTRVKIYAQSIVMAERVKRTRGAAEQRAFGFMRRGGVRENAGRKPKIAGQPGVSHRRREGVCARHPLHVTLRLRDDVPNVRRQALLAPLMSTLRAGRVRDGFRLCHFVIMGNHLHLIVEADDGEKLARGMQGLSIRVAKRVNRELGRKGGFFADRYHARVLKTPTEVHRALGYVLRNLAKHTAERSPQARVGLDAFSSGAWFEGWRSPLRAASRLRADHEEPVTTPRSWLLREGWRRGGPPL
jgi:REP element-mobilizing transposase RayT